MSNDETPQVAGAATAQAVLYLRVSTPRQMDTASDVDADGNSIATQREATIAKAAALGADIKREFLEPGNSAQTIEKRPVFQEMLLYVAEHPEIKYVIIYMRSRAFRNQTDAAITKRHLRNRGVRLVSVKEDFGEGVAADAMEAMLDTVNELQVRMNGEDIKIKMRHKAMRGGTLGRARLGYLNARIEHEGHFINTIQVDPVRQPLIVQIFELYATGEYSLDRLQATMADRGLMTRATARWPSQPVSVNKLHQMLQDPYYVGMVTYKGEVVPGNHEALISHELFDQVRAVMEARSKRGNRDRVHHHYLKGMLFCARCKAAGRESRLIYTLAKSRSGEQYGYFFCRARPEGLCNLPYLPAEAIEDAVERHYATLSVTEEFTAKVRGLIDETLGDEQTNVRQLHATIAKQLTALEVKEENLLDLAADGSMPQAKIRSRLTEISVRRERLRQELSTVGTQLQAGADLVRRALSLLEDPSSAYRRSRAGGRRLLNQTFWELFWVDEDGVESARPKEPFGEITETARTLQNWTLEPGPRSRTQKSPVRTLAGADGAQTADRLVGIFSADGSTKAVMVEIVRRYRNSPGLADDLARATRRILAGAAKTERRRAEPAESRHYRQLRLSALPPTVAAELVARFNSGVPKSVLAADYGTSRSSVQRMIRKHRE